MSEIDLKKITAEGLKKLLPEEQFTPHFNMIEELHYRMNMLNRQMCWVYMNPNKSPMINGRLDNGLGILYEIKQKRYKKVPFWEVPRIRYHDLI